ncbi:MAG: DUF3579 domain-containing protein [Gammaproteobacteria bacterium]
MVQDATNERFIIEGVSEDNRKFRPSDWAERISAMIAHFGPDHKLHYSDLVHPCIIEGKQCLIVARGLSELNPDAYQFIIAFAKENQLRIQEDRRSKTRGVLNDRRSNTNNIKNLTNNAAA